MFSRFYRFPVLAMIPFLMAAKAPPLTCSELPRILDAMVYSHYHSESLSKSVPERAIKKFIERMDSTRTLFLESEVQSMHSDLKTVYKDMYAGDCSRLEKVSKLAIARTIENESIVKELLDASYQLDDQVTLQFDPDKRGYPTTQSQRRKLIQDMVQFQISNQLIAKKTMSEAKKVIQRRFSLTTKRVKDRRSVVDLPGIFADSYAHGLDPHSTYYSAEDLEDFRIQMGLSLEGIGATLRSEDGYTWIDSIVTGGAADKEGSLRPQDKVIAVAQDGQPAVSTIDMDLRDVVQMIRGKKGTKVILTVLREDKGTQTLEITIVRDKIDVKDQAAKISYVTKRAPMSGKKRTIAVLDLPAFYQDDGGRSSYRDVRNLLLEAKRKKVDGLVLDLSENGGGSLDYAVRISGLFINTGNIVATKSMRGTRELADQDEGTVFTGPMAVLISPISASASEIVAGALKDYNRALIVGGKHTYGKGSVQQVFPLPTSKITANQWGGDNGAIKITIGMFFRPSGSSTQQAGVRSHIHIPSPLDAIDYSEKDLDYSLPPQSISSFRTMTANSDNPSDAWKEISGNDVEILGDRSMLRVKKNTILQQVMKDLESTNDNDGPIKLAELRKKALEDKRDENEDSDSYETKKAAFVDEGVNLVLDLLELQN